MSKLSEAKTILQALGLPPAQCNEMSCLTLLALAGVKPRGSWKDAKRSRTSVSKGVMTFVRDHYHKDYAENTRETFRRQVLHQFVQANLAEYNPFEPNLATNSPRAHYALHEDVLPVFALIRPGRLEKSDSRNLLRNTVLFLSFTVPTV